MMMKMLETGGMPVLVDHIRNPDEDNPLGYYEYETVKTLAEGCIDWLPKAQGKAVKVIAALIPYLPPNNQYQIIFMQRDMSEILASQKKMLANRGQDPNSVDTGLISGIYQKHIKQVMSWISANPNVKLIEINYNQFLLNPVPMIARIVEFTGGTLDAEAMKKILDPSLYRQRNPGN